MAFRRRKQGKSDIIEQAEVLVIAQGRHLAAETGGMTVCFSYSLTFNFFESMDFSEQAATRLQP
ncbi:hypothetical protein BML2496_20290 [Providencia rettgeri]|nr:hypothetical protein BML2496_20290 [Providencia rettgeri]